MSALREAHQRIRELERLLGKKHMEIEILQREVPGISDQPPVGLEQPLLQPKVT